jgi:hypothetical protein
MIEASKVEVIHCLKLNMFPVQAPITLFELCRLDPMISGFPPTLL